MSLMQEYKVLILIFIVILFVGFVSAEEKYDKVVINDYVKAHVPICELGKFIGNGDLQVKTYYENGKPQWGITTLAILSKERVLDSDVYKFKLFCGRSYSFSGLLIAHDGMNHKLQIKDENFMSVFRTSLSFLDDHYSIDVTPDEGYLIKWDGTLGKDLKTWNDIVEHW